MFLVDGRVWSGTHGIQIDKTLASKSTSSIDVYLHTLTLENRAAFRNGRRCMNASAASLRTWETGGVLRCWRPVVAVLGAVFIGSLGLMYLGKLRRAILWYAAHLVWHCLYIAWIASGTQNRWVMCSLLAAFPMLWIARVADTFWIARRTTINRPQWYQRWYFYLFALFLGWGGLNLIVQINNAYFSEVFFVPMRAMAKTILPQDRIIVSKINPDPKALKIGDIVVYRSGADAKAPLFVMRIVGLAGDHVRMEQGQLFRNDVPVDERSYCYFSGNSIDPRQDDFNDLVIPENHYFVLGDHRNLAMDSRLRGPIPFDRHYGKAEYVFWSLFKRMSDDPTDTTGQSGPLRWDRIGLPFY
jgi:signal peptidase I